MPFSGDTFTKLYSWLNDPQRNEKIFNSRLDDEFGGIATGLTTLGGRSSALEIAVAGLGGGTPVPCFSAHKNGADQTGIADSTFTQLTFGTEVFDVGGHFASNAWTPPGGKVFLSCTALLGGDILANAVGAAAIYKDGSPIAQHNSSGCLSGQSGVTANIVDIATGSNVYTAYAYTVLNSGTATAVGGSHLTYFCGHWISM